MTEVLEFDKLAVVIGILCSIATQMVKRQRTGWLEAVGMTLGVVGAGIGIATTQTSAAPSMVQAQVTAWAFHGLFGQTPPMAALRFGALDALFGGIAKAFASGDSRGSQPHA